FSSRRRHTRFSRDWSSDVCSSDLLVLRAARVDVDDVVVRKVSVDLAVEPAELLLELQVVEDLGALAASLAAASGLARIEVEHDRSEERRVGKEWRDRRASGDVNKT